MHLKLSLNLNLLILILSFIVVLFLTFSVIQLFQIVNYFNSISYLEQENSNLMVKNKLLSLEVSGAVSKLEEVLAKEDFEPIKEVTFIQAISEVASR